MVKLSYRQPIMVEKFNANTNAERIIQTRMENICSAIEEGNTKWLENCILAAESIVISEGVNDENFLYANLKLKQQWQDEYNKLLKDYESECNDSLCSEVINKPNKSPSFEHLLERATLIIEFTQRKGIFLRTKNSLQYGRKK